MQHSHLAHALPNTSPTPQDHAGKSGRAARSGNPYLNADLDTLDKWRAAQSPQSLIGKSLAEAESYARLALSASVRPVKVDGNFLMCTRDWKPDRINVEVEGGVVVKVAGRG